MHAKSHVGLAVGPVDENRWGQVLMQPEGYGVVEIESADGRAQEIGVRLLSALGAKLSGRPNSLKDIEKAVRDVATAEVRTLIVFVPVGRVVYLVLHGEGVLYLRRGNQIAILMQKSGGISGEIRAGDTLLLVSTGFSRHLSQQDIAAFFDHDPADVVAEKLTLALHEKVDGEGSVALVYQVERFEDDEPLPSEPLQHAPLSDKPKAKQPIAVGENIRTWVNTRIEYVSDLRHRPREAKKLLVIVLGGLFLASVVLGIWKQVSVKVNREMEAAMSDARHTFDEGVALLPLNPVKGRERLLQAKERLDPFVSKVNPRTQAGHTFGDLYDQIQGYVMQSMQISQGNPSLFYDMTLMKKEAVASTFALTGNILAIADSANGTVYRLDITTKNTTIVGGGGNLQGVSSIAIHGENIFAFTPAGIVEIRHTDKKSSLVIAKDQGWGNISSIIAFGGNVYLLDTLKSRIWKYVAIDTIKTASASGETDTGLGFSSIREYLNPDTLPNFSNATNMSIDGTVWVGSRTGHIFHFVQGREETYIPKGVEPVIGADTQIYSTDLTRNVYVLDHSNNRVVVLDRDGTYLAQYQWTDELQMREFAVSEEQKKILFLTGGKIYSIDLK